MDCPLLLEPFLCENIPPFWVYCIDGVFVVVGAFEITDEAATKKAFEHFLSKHSLLKQIFDTPTKIPKNTPPKKPQTTPKSLRIDEKAIQPIYLLAIDGENHLLTDGLGVIQGFDEAAFIDALSLPSASDFVAFLAYRQSLLQNGLGVDCVEAAQSFMRSPAFFQRAWHTEKQLQKYDYMVRVSPAIKSAIYKNQSVIKNLVERQCALTPLWHRMVARLLDKTGDVALAQKLQAQSGYTAMKIVEFVLDYQNFDVMQKAEGKISHEHSYHRVGQHFVLVICGTNQSSELSLQSLQQSHHTILAHYQKELIHKVKEVFLLGFDLSQKDEHGNIMVNMEVWSGGI